MKFLFWLTISVMLFLAFEAAYLSKYPPERGFTESTYRGQCQQLLVREHVK